MIFSVYSEAIKDRSVVLWFYSDAQGLAVSYEGSPSCFGDVSQNGHIHLLILMDGDIPKACHSDHIFQQVFADVAGLMNQLKGLRTGLRHAEALLRYDVHGQVDRGLARPFHVQCHRIDVRVIIQRRIGLIFLPHPS